MVFDWEIVNNAGSRTRSYPRSDVADFITAYCDAVAAAGFDPVRRPETLSPQEWLALFARCATLSLP